MNVPVVEQRKPTRICSSRMIREENNI